MRMAVVFVGMGVHGVKGIPVGAVEELRECGRVLLDTYTTPIDASRAIEELRAVLGINAVEADRDALEDIPGILREAADGCLGILIPGDVFVATTHDAIRQEAMKSGVDVRVWHSSSIVSSALSRLGLHIYKLGFIGTLVEGPPQTAYRVYFGVAAALRGSQHSILLLQHDPARGEGIDVRRALEQLSAAEGSWRMGVFGRDRVIAVASRLYSESEAIRVIRLGDALDEDFGGHPHTIIVPGRLHYTEAEAIGLISGAPEELLNSIGAVPLSLGTRLANTAMEKTRRALPRFRELLRAVPSANPVLENVDSYLSDAERFLREGNVELALAEAGYAEGLLDSLRLLGYADVDW